MSARSPSADMCGGHDEEPVETVDAVDFVAGVPAHIPDPCRHLVHYYGAYLQRGAR